MQSLIMKAILRLGDISRSIKIVFLVFVWSDSGGTSQYIPMIYLTIT